MSFLSADATIADASPSPNYALSADVDNASGSSIAVAASEYFHPDGASFFAEPKASFLFFRFAAVVRVCRDTPTLESAALMNSTRLFVQGATGAFESTFVACQACDACAFPAPWTTSDHQPIISTVAAATPTPPQTCLSFPLCDIQQSAKRAYLAGQPFRRVIVTMDIPFCFVDVAPFRDFAQASQAQRAAFASDALARVASTLGVAAAQLVLKSASALGEFDEFSLAEAYQVGFVTHVALCQDNHHLTCLLQPITHSLTLFFLPVPSFPYLPFLTFLTLPSFPYLPYLTLPSLPYLTFLTLPSFSYLPFLTFLPLPSFPSLPFLPSLPLTGLRCRPVERSASRFRNRAVDTVHDDCGSARRARRRLVVGAVETDGDARGFVHASTHRRRRRRRRAGSDSNTDVRCALLQRREKGHVDVQSHLHRGRVTYIHVRRRRCRRGS
jgi:hypothetical protein